MFFLFKLNTRSWSAGLVTELKEESNVIKRE